MTDLNNPRLTWNLLLFFMSCQCFNKRELAKIAAAEAAQRAGATIDPSALKLGLTGKVTIASYQGKR
jgi:hypothetical protein